MSATGCLGKFQKQVLFIRYGELGQYHHKGLQGIGRYLFSRFPYRYRGDLNVLRGGAPAPFLVADQKAKPLNGVADIGSVLYGNPVEKVLLFHKHTGNRQGDAVIAFI